jgi:hypothetical protein
VLREYYFFSHSKNICLCLCSLEKRRTPKTLEGVRATGEAFGTRSRDAHDLVHRRHTLMRVSPTPQTDVIVFVLIADGIDSAFTSLGRR